MASAPPGKGFACCFKHSLWPSEAMAMLAKISSAPAKLPALRRSRKMKKEVAAK